MLFFFASSMLSFGVDRYGINTNDIVVWSMHQ